MTHAIRPIRWWVRIYTAGLPPSIREHRRAEIESDLWEQSHFAAEHGSGRLGFAQSVWTRWLLGIGDDLMWRAEQRAAGRVRRNAQGRSLKGPGVSRLRLIGLGSAITIALALIGLMVIVSSVEYREGSLPGGDVAVMLIALTAAIAIVGGITVARGFRIIRDRPAEGVLLVVGGSFVAALAWYWLFVPVVLAVIVSVYAASRALWLSDDGAGPSRESSMLATAPNHVMRRRGGRDGRSDRHAHDAVGRGRSDAV